MYAIIARARKADNDLLLVLLIMFRVTSRVRISRHLLNTLTQTHIVHGMKYMVYIVKC